MDALVAIAIRLVRAGSLQDKRKHREPTSHLMKGPQPVEEDEAPGWGPLRRQGGFAAEANLKRGPTVEWAYAG